MIPERAALEAWVRDIPNFARRRRRSTRTLSHSRLFSPKIQQWLVHLQSMSLIQRDPKETTKKKDQRPKTQRKNDEWPPKWQRSLAFDEWMNECCKRELVNEWMNEWIGTREKWASIFPISPVVFRGSNTVVVFVLTGAREIVFLLFASSVSEASERAWCLSIGLLPWLFWMYIHLGQFRVDIINRVLGWAVRRRRRFKVYFGDVLIYGDPRGFLGG